MPFTLSGIQFVLKNMFVKGKTKQLKNSADFFCCTM